MSRILDWKKYEDTARQMVAEGTVLLKNEDQTLPLKKGTRVSVFGRMQNDYYKSGTGSGGMVNVSYVIDILEGLRRSGHVQINEELCGIYREWEKTHPFDAGFGWGQEPWSQEEMLIDEAVVAKAAEVSDLAICIIARTAGEDSDARKERGSYLLQEKELDMLRKVRANFRKMVVLLNVGGIMDMNELEEINPQSIVYVWQGGMVGGLGTADVLTGKVSPSGKLADTIAYEIEDYPANANFGDPDKNFYKEDIFVGYRYFETFAKDRVRYPFGFGLSYTTFEYKVLEAGAVSGVDTAKATSVSDEDILKTGNISNVAESKTGSVSASAESSSTDSRDSAIAAEGKAVHPSMIIKVQVTNTGTFPGKEVIQVYGQAPMGRLGKAARVLLAFAKTKELQPGESELLTIHASLEMLESYDDSGVTGYANAFVMENGEYHIHVGNSIRSTTDCFTFELAETKVIRRLEEALAPYDAFERYHAYEDEQGQAALKMEDTPTVTADMEQRRREEAARLEKEWAPFNIYKAAAGQSTSNFATEAETNQSASNSAKPVILLSDVESGKATIEEFVAQLDDEQLACIVRGEGMGSSLVTPGTASALGGVSPKLRELGIPAVCCDDGPSGMRLDCGMKAFSLPCGAIAASSFNRELNEELYTLLGLEMVEKKVDVLLGPGVNIHRYPLNGRNFEYFSEDPYLTGAMAAAQLKGLKNSGVSGTLKHFCGNNQEYRRHFVDSVISQRALREIYLKSFELPVESGYADSVMTTYGILNGSWTAASYDLNTTVLRKDWGFKGIVMTDWWADVNDRGKGPSHTNFSAMVRSQNDLYMVCPDGSSNRNEGDGADAAFDVDAKPKNESPAAAATKSQNESPAAAVTKPQSENSAEEAATDTAQENTAAEKKFHGDNTLEALGSGELTRAELQRTAVNVCSFVLTTSAYRLAQGKEEEVEIINRPPDPEEDEIRNVEFIELGQDYTMDLTYKESKADTSYPFAFDVKKPMKYKVTLRASSQLSDLAQLPCTLFFNGFPVCSFAFHGTGGKVMEIEREFDCFNRFNIFRLYVKSNGLKLHSVSFHAVAESKFK